MSNVIPKLLSEKKMKAKEHRVAKAWRASAVGWGQQLTKAHVGPAPALLCRFNAQENTF